MEYNYEQHIDSIGEIADRINRDADYIIIDEPEIGIGEELQLGLNISY